MTTTTGEQPSADGLRLLAIELYQAALDDALAEAKGEKIDTTDVAEDAAQRLHERARFRTLEMARLAVNGITGGVERGRAPRFKQDGSVTMRLWAILRVDDKLVVAAQFAREDDWLAWLGIHRTNADAVALAQSAKELGVARIVADLRAAGAGSMTYDVRPDLFVADEIDDQAGDG